MLTNSLSSQQNFLLENFVTWTCIQVLGLCLVGWVTHSTCVHDTHRFIVTIRECGSPLRQGDSVGAYKPGNCVSSLFSSSSRLLLCAYTSATAKAVPYELNNGTWQPNKLLLIEERRRSLSIGNRSMASRSKTSCKTVICQQAS